jgi:hypothetical protein
MTAAKDGYVIIWQLTEQGPSTEEDSDPEDMFKFLEDCELSNPLTKAKWLTNNMVVASTTTGRLLVFSIENS